MGARDELGTGEMWNSSSVIAWVLVRSGIHAEAIPPPAGGRAPGWQAGIEIAHRQEQQTRSARDDRVTGGAPPPRPTRALPPPFWGREQRRALPPASGAPPPPRAPKGSPPPQRPG